jgi:hypothetical protein
VRPGDQATTPEPEGRVHTKRTDVETR